VDGNSPDLCSVKRRELYDDGEHHALDRSFEHVIVIVPAVFAAVFFFANLVSSNVTNGTT
jgi:hypothetical protein